MKKEKNQSREVLLTNMNARQLLSAIGSLPNPEDFRILINGQMATQVILDYAPGCINLIDMDGELTLLDPKKLTPIQ